MFSKKNIDNGINKQLTMCSFRFLGGFSFMTLCYTKINAHVQFVVMSFTFLQTNNHSRIAQAKRPSIISMVLSLALAKSLS
jgi:hypothetical protein